MCPNPAMFPKSTPTIHFRSPLTLLAYSRESSYSFGNKQLVLVLALMISWGGGNFLVLIECSRGQIKKYIFNLILNNNHF